MDTAHFGPGCHVKPLCGARGSNEETEMAATQEAFEQSREAKLEREMRALGLQVGGYEMGGFMRIVSRVGAAHYERILARKRQQIAEVRH